MFLNDLASPLEQFELGILKEILVCDKGLNFGFSNLSFFFFILVACYLIFYVLIFKNKSEKVLANPFQIFFEQVHLFIFNTLIENLKWNDIKYFALILTTFQIILFSNIIGIFPYTFTITGHLVVTFGIAFCIFLGLNIIGYIKHRSNILSLLLPEGVPFAISSLLIIIEFISYNFRVISLSVRLFANIMAGHTLLAVIFSFNHYLLAINAKSMMIVLLPVILFPILALILALMSLEVGVAMIQAYVFTLLCVMYLHDAKYLH